jgi:hypothetical protein
LDKHTAYFNLLDALPEPGCVICRLGHDVEVKYIRDVLYGQTTSVETRAELRGARGFCLFHARQLDEIGHALDVSIIYQDIILTLKEILNSPSPRRIAHRRGKKGLADALAATRQCPACVYRAELEQVYVETLLDHLVDPDFVVQVRAADPVCLAHLRQLVLNTYQVEQFEILRDIQTAHWEKLIAELGEFVRKHDHRFHDEKVGSEGTAWIRAVDAIAGTRKY